MRVAHGDLAGSRFERHNTIILKLHHRLIRGLARHSTVFGSFEFFFINLGVGNHFRRTKHAQPDSRREASNLFRASSNWARR